jgi:hypothetical protein
MVSLSDSQKEGLPPAARPEYDRHYHEDLEGEGILDSGLRAPYDFYRKTNLYPYQFLQNLHDKIFIAGVTLTTYPTVLFFTPHRRLFPLS